MSIKYYRKRLLILALTGVLCTVVPINALAASETQQSEQEYNDCQVDDLLKRITEDSLEEIEEIETPQEIEESSESAKEPEESSESAEEIEENSESAKEPEESNESAKEIEESSESAKEPEESSESAAETEEIETAETESAVESSQEIKEEVESSSETEELTEKEQETKDNILSETVSGKQGSNITWTLTPEGVLTIKGNGRIYPYYENYEMHSRVYYGWDCYAADIKRIAIGEGITDIPEYAFYYMTELRVVLLPDTIKELKMAAFADNPKLCAVYFMGDAPNLGRAVFDGCSQDLSLYYLHGKNGWNQVDEYKVAVWKNAAAISAQKKAEQKKPYKQNGQQGDSVDTGDGSEVYDYIGMMLVSIAGAGFVLTERKKQMRNLVIRPQMKGREDEIS